MSDNKFNFTWGLPELEQLGFVQVYGFMLKHYASLGVTRQEMLCIIHLASYRWNTPTTEGSKPSQATIAKEMGYGHANRVGELIRSLEEKNLMVIEHNPGFVSIYDFSPFARKCLGLYLQEVDTPTEKRGGDQRKNVGGINGKTLMNKKEEVEEVTPLTSLAVGEGKEEKPQPFPADDSYTITYHFKKKEHVRAIGNWTNGPWAVSCDCGNSVTIDRMGVAVECLCGMHEYILTKTKPETKIKRDYDAVEAYLLIAGRKRGSVAKEWLDEITATVVDVPFWRRVVKEWCGLGWNRGNVSKMLDYYKERKIPGTRQKLTPEDAKPDISYEGGKKVLTYTDKEQKGGPRITYEDGVRVMNYD